MRRQVLRRSGILLRAQPTAARASSSSMRPQAETIPGGPKTSFKAKIRNVSRMRPSPSTFSYPLEDEADDDAYYYDADPFFQEADDFMGTPPPMPQETEIVDASPPRVEAIPDATANPISRNSTPKKVGSTMRSKKDPDPSDGTILLAPERDLSKPTVKTMADYDSMEDYLNDHELRSRPKSNWNVQDPLGWARDFGNRSTNYEKDILKDKIKLGPGDEGYFEVSQTPIQNVQIVRTKEQARAVLDRLMAADPRIYHACDTEVMDIDLKSVGPVGNGYVTCVSIYSGPDFDYGEGPGKTLWIDNLDDACGILQEFKSWFEDERYLKVWHNYGFDRHVMFNEGIDVKGFGGDTMHMARLHNTARLTTGGGYSLESLTADLLKRRKQPMKEIFGIKRLRKDGTEGSLVDVPPVEVMQRDPKHRKQWILYSSYDAEGTWLLRQELEKQLREQWWIQDKNLFDYYWMHMRPFGEVLTDMERRGIRVDAEDYLASVEMQARQDRDNHDKAFREWAAKQIGPDGLALNSASAAQLCTFLFGGAENVKTKELTEKVRIFKVPRVDVPEEALEAFRLRDEANTPEEEEDETIEGTLSKKYDGMKVVELKEECKKFKLKISGKKAELQERIKEYLRTEAAASVSSGNAIDDYESMELNDLKDALVARCLPVLGDREVMIKTLKEDIQMTDEVKQNFEYNEKDGYHALCKILEEAAKSGGPLSEFMEEQKKKGKAIPKHVEVKITSLGLKPEKFTAGGAPSVTADVLRVLAGDPFADPPKYGTAFDAVGEEGCKALWNLCAIGSIDTMIANFLTSLQELADHDSRVHCSLNLNTETGRLSSRRPNLQNQPALEKDKYKIRKAFQASPGNSLIVADYGQLELRLLASITNCKSMIDAFAAGGDFHSRTAMDMFPYVKESLDAGECLLEWDYSKGDPPKPLLKDLFGSERRKAKTLNFSIAYGKTAHGLSQDWGVSKSEATKMLNAWYDARPEVKKWQTSVKKTAEDRGITRTLMGRYRQLPHGTNPDERKLFGHAQRASINTPIQGGAADIAMMAMNKINENKKLQQLGWILLLQIHDEVIMEGPEETAEEAFGEVLKCMQEPWVFGLAPTAVPLSVDGSYTHKTWFDAK